MNGNHYIKITGWFIFIIGLISLFIIPHASAFKLNKHGKNLINQANQAYQSDMKNRPSLVDRGINSYVHGVVKRLIPPGKRPPQGVVLNTTVIESPKPELYSYVNGNIVVTTGTVFAMDNEAQLAGVLSHEVATVVEGYYIQMYQAVKAAERRRRWRAAVGALFSSFLDVGVDYVAQVESSRQTDKLFSGEQTYSETMRRLAGISAAQGAYYGVKDVISSVPPKDKNGQWIDPRQRFEPVADAQGMEYMALAGYDPAEASKGWQKIHRINYKMARSQEQAMGPWAAQMREMQSLMELNMRRFRQNLGASGLVQSISDAPPSRSKLVARLTNLKEVKAATKKHGRRKGRKEYVVFIKKHILPRANKAFEREAYDQAHRDYQALYSKGIKTAPIAYGLAKSKLGDFAFGASEADKQTAEKRYKEAIRLNSKYAKAYKGLGELYEDWERYKEAVWAYTTYLKKSPKAKDSGKVKRKIKVLKRKASR